MQRYNIVGWRDNNKNVSSPKNNNINQYKSN